MGLFKDMKNMKDAVGDLGGMPSMKDSRKMMSQVFDDHGEKDILATGTPAKVLVTGLPQQVQGQMGSMQVTVEVHPTGGAPYPVNYVFPAMRMKVPPVVGMELPCKVSAADPQKIAIQWDVAQAAAAAAGGNAAFVRAGVDNAIATGLVQTVPAAGAQPDAASRLKQLEDLKAAGAIDEATYAAKKQEIIAAL